MSAGGAGGRENWRAGFALLAEPNFRRLFAARFISAFGTAMTPVALPFAVLDLTGRAGDIGWVLGAAAVSQLTVQLFAGALADRGSRQRLMVRAEGLAACAQLASAALLLLGLATVPLLTALYALTGIAYALIWPSLIGLVPLVAPPQKLQAANALLSAAHSLAMGLGMAAGGGLAAVLGAGWAIALDGATFAASGLLVLGLRTSPQPKTAPSSLWRDLQSGWREFTSHRWLWTIVAQFSLVVMAWEGTFGVVGPYVAKHSLGGAHIWGLISGCLGAGWLLGGLIAMRLRFRRPLLVGTLGIFVSALLPLSLIVPLPPPWIAASAFAAGVGGECFGVVWNTAIHTHIAPEAISRVVSYDVLGSIALMPVGAIVAGQLVDQAGPPAALWLAALLILLPTAAVLAVPEVRRLRSAAPPGGPG
ncbi:MAG: MFS transporter [Deltaproteobacteria bacterium]|nr:MFS transporter [Deltaproteobacteria bacterium]